ncbi:iron chelate uptake ABC transporter family permease subunit, partial [Staphylococcus aureus]
IGNTLVAPVTVIQALFNYDSANDLHDVFTGARASRTIIAVLTRHALVVSGRLMQALQRNPIASTGPLVVNA